MVRRLTPAEKALWHQLARTVRPFSRAQERYQAEAAGPGASRESAPADALAAQTQRPLSGHRPAHKVPQPAATAPIDRRTLDGQWDRTLKRGEIAPDRTIDLHGYGQDRAHAALDAALRRGVADRVRVLLVITGKPAPDNPRLPPTRRGIIRASIHDWLAASPMAGHIAAVRNAHPRHGGQGALYVILKAARKMRA